jgi:hypothetical protein
LIFATWGALTVRASWVSRKLSNPQTTKFTGVSSGSWDAKRGSS